MPAAEMRVLGPVELVGNEGRAVPLAAKHKRLLAALVVGQGRTCTVDELIESVWNDSPPTSARNLVQVYVSQLRKTLPAGVGIVTRGGAYALEVAPGRLDAARFEGLLGESRAARRDGNPALALSLADQALALWRGRAYGELAYDDFASAESERLEELRLVAVEERFDARLALGRHDEVLGDVLAHAGENPLRERTHELAMLALYRCGRQADALEHFMRVRAELREELGLEPGPALRGLQRRILEQDPSLDIAAEDAQAAAALPVPPTPLVGRERELEELAALLAHREARLIVLTGAGGSGKTRLALEATRRTAGSFANGARLVELAPLRDPILVVPTIAQTLGVADDAHQQPLEALVAALRPQELLLLVDNAEHVREAAPSFAQLAAAAPRLTMLVTSRAVLHVSGEHVFPVSPLAEEDAVELFVQRARLLAPSFALTAETDSDVRRICRRVDCLPLAIELAAARLRTLTPRALLERLDSSLGVLTGGPRDLPARQQTLRKTIAWSVELLRERERDVFARLAVFPVGATLEAAEAVCGADLDLLGELVDHHLVVRRDLGGEPRFGMLETVREYALELLSDERLEVEHSLAEYFARFADELRVGASENELRSLVDELEPEIENIRTALAAAAASGDGELQLRLAGGLSRYWQYRGPVAEGLDWIEGALTASDGAATAARAHALRAAAGLAWMRGDVARATELAEAAIPVAIETRAKADELAANTVLGIVANARGDRERARYHHRRSLELAEELGVEPVVQKLNLGVVALDCGDHEEAIALFEDVLASHRRHERPAGIGYALLNLGLAHWELRDHEASRREFEEARECFAQAGLREQLAQALQGLAAAEAHESRFESAARLLGEARKELDDVGALEDGFAEEMVAETKARARAALGDGGFETAYARDSPQDEDKAWLQ
jgi:predicted ATPase/DNA-binding SARP family transcriptional activator